MMVKKAIKTQEADKKEEEIRKMSKKSIRNIEQQTKKESLEINILKKDLQNKIEGIIEEMANEVDIKEEEIIKMSQENMR